MRRPEVTSAIVDMAHPSEIEEIIVAGERMLSKQDIEAIDALVDKGLFSRAASSFASLLLESSR